jgi:hypothetical protein
VAVSSVITARRHRSGTRTQKAFYTPSPIDVAGGRLSVPTDEASLHNALPPTVYALMEVR